MKIQKEIKNPNELIEGFGLPNYESITLEKISEQIPILLANLKNELNKVESGFRDLTENNHKLIWSHIMDPLQKIGERLRWSWGVVVHLNGVSNSKELREVYSTLQPEIIRFSNRLAQSEIIYEVLNKLYKELIVVEPEFNHYETSQNEKLLNDYIEVFEQQINELYSNQEELYGVTQSHQHELEQINKKIN